MKLFIKFSILVGILSSLLVGSFYYTWKSQSHILESAHKLHIESFKKTFNEIVKLSSEKFKNFGFDYSYWDELVDFVISKDSEWARINLETALSAFDVNFIYVVNTNGEYVYKKDTLGIDITNQISKKDFNFNRPIMKSYFVKKDKYIVEVFIYPIQKSDDLQRSTKPLGYFIIGKIWDENYINTLSLVAQQKVYFTKTLTDSDDFLYPLKGENNKTIAMLGVKMQDEEFEVLNNSFTSLGFVLASISIIAFILIAFFFVIVILRPMKNIAKSLHNNSLDDINLVMKQDDEFGTIAKLVKYHFEQNKKLENTLQEKFIHDRILIQQSKLASMGEMIGNIAHQWRQPLNALALQVQDIGDAYEFEEINKEYVDTFIDKSMTNINFMSKTIDDFRNFFKPNKDIVNFSVVTSINDAIEISLGLINKYGITIEMQKNDEEKFFVDGFENEFKQVIINILKNAIDVFSEKIDSHCILHPKISIQLAKVENNILIQVQDNAGGIPENIIDRVFEPYFTTKGDSRGTGIGLYMSKMIIEENMKGKITVDNQYEGALFSIILNTMKTAKG